MQLTCWYKAENWGKFAITHQLFVQGHRAWVPLKVVVREVWNYVGGARSNQKVTWMLFSDSYFYRLSHIAFVIVLFLIWWIFKLWRSNEIDTGWKELDGRRASLTNNTLCTIHYYKYNIMLSTAAKQLSLMWAL